MAGGGGGGGPGGPGPRCTRLNAARTRYFAAAVLPLRADSARDVTSLGPPAPPSGAGAAASVAELPPLARAWAAVLAGTALDEST